MKSWVSARRLAAGIFPVILVCLSSAALANVGRTVGTYQVSPTGAATYTIPIWAPRGPNGLQPHIALTYSSQQGIGYVGVGWAVAGISSVYRCNLTYAQDGNPEPVALKTSDGLCLDGQRLRLTSGTQGEAGSTYQTEVANFENVTANGTAGNGPAYFVVQGPDGTQYEYGNTAVSSNSQVLASGTSTAFQWYLDKETDTFGNTMTVSYDAATGAVVPDTISWTPTSYGATTYSYTMKFAYGTNASTSSTYAYVAGTPVVNTNLLTSITIAYSNSTVKKYALTYQQSPTTGREELTQVEECADDAQTNCLAPTTITYQNGTAGTATTATAALSSAYGLVWGYDFNGDGRTDVAWCTSQNPSSGTIEVALATGSGYGTPISTGAPCAGALYGDLLGNGQDAILANSGGTWYYYSLDGSSFSSSSTGLAYDSTASQYALADVDGDGLADLVESKVTSTGLTIYVRLNTGSGSAVSFSSSNTAWFADSDANISGAQMTSNTSGAFGRLSRLDFNGDGRDDLALQVQDTITVHGPHGIQVTYKLGLSELISTPSGFSQTTILQKSQSTYMPYVEIAFLNFNSDSCTDYLLPGDGSTTKNAIYISGCNGSLPETLSFGPAPVIGAMDWNGDGLTDILVQNGSAVGVYESTGNGLSSLISTSVPYSSSNTYFTVDADGDGLDDLGVWSQQLPYAASYFDHNGNGQPPDLLSSVTDGYGNFVKPSYVSIAQAVNSIYFVYDTAAFPYENYLGPLYVVSQTVFNDPSNPPNGTYTQGDQYSGAWMNLQGRGFASFNSHILSDSRKNIWERWTYDHSFPYTGMVLSHSADVSNDTNQPIFSASYTPSTPAETALPDERYFPYVTGSTESDYEVGGAETGELIRTKTGSYSYDNYGNLLTASQTVTDNDSGDQYYNGDSWTTSLTNTPDPDTSTWCLRLSSGSQITYTASDGSASVTRTRTYNAPDMAHCRYTQIQSDASTSYEVTEGLVYDSFGNVETDTVTGTGMTARVTTANWGTTGQFPMSVTDAAGATTQFNYNFGYGLVSSETDPNGLTTSWQYGDGFGRLTQETRPDGTSTSYSYSNCASSGGCLMGANTLAVAHYVYETDGKTIETDGTTFYDELERPVLSNNMMLSETQWNRNEVRYDSLGRVVQRAAPCVWSAVTTPCSYWTTMDYDILNRLTEVQRPINQNDSTLQSTGYAYAGDTTTITDPNGHARTLVHDVNGWLRHTTDALGYTVILNYDAVGNKTAVTDLNNDPLWSGTYSYPVAPFLVGEKDMDRGTWGYTVDALGERTAWTDPKGQEFYETYDALSRPLSRTEPDLFTQWTWGSSASSHNIGQLASVCTGTGSACSSSYYSESEAYDGLARLSQRSIVAPSMGTYTYTWQYNAATGLLDTLTYPISTSGKALQLKYAYQAGILASITDVLDSPNVTVWQAGAENPAGQITQETLGNGLVTSRAYDAVTHWLSTVQSGPSGGASVQNQSFLYDEVGNVSQRQDNNLGLSENFYYDNDNRLSYSTLNGTQNLSLSYNSMGNITSRTDVAGGAAWTYDPVHLHQVTEAGSSANQYAYDANGNVTSRQGSSISWSSYNYPTQINDTATGETVSFLYGPDRRAYFEQTQSSSGTETNYHVGGLLDIVSSGGVTDYRHYIYAGSEPVAIDSRKSSGTNAFYYLLSDHEGSISAITNSAGAVVVGESFTASGNRRNPTTWSGVPNGSDLSTIAGITRQGYTFQDTLGQMGLNDMVGRVQDAITGRFLSADPYIPDPTDPQSYNRYSYTRNNPLSSVDSSGFDDTDTDHSGGGGTDFDAAMAVWSNTILAGLPDLSGDGSQSMLADFVIGDLNSGNFDNLGLSSDELESLGLSSGNSGTFGGNRGIGNLIGGAQQSSPPTVGQRQQQNNPTSPTTLPQVTVTSKPESTFSTQNNFSSAFNTWFNGQTQWFPAGQRATAGALQQAALPPKLILKLVSWSGVSAQQDDPADTIFPWAGAGAVGGGAFGGYAGASFTFGYFEAVEAAELGEEGGVVLVAMGAGDAIAGGMIAGASLGLVPGAIIGGIVGVGVYLYESQQSGH